MLNKALKLVLGLVILATPVVFVPEVFAVTSTTNVSPESARATEAAKKSKERDLRISAYKTKYATSLTKVQETKLKTTCKPAQVKVKLLNEKAIKNDTVRAKAYEVVGAELSKIIPRLKDASISTTDLEEYQTQLTVLIKTYSTDSLAFASSLQDTAELDCLTDPAAFKSSLDSARADRLKLVTSSKAVATYVTETIKPGLEKKHLDLQVKDMGTQ